MKVLLSLLFLFISFAAAAQPFAPGSKVDVYATDGKYYGATVVERKGDEYKIRYLGYGLDKDVWVKENSLVRGGRRGDRVVVAGANGFFNGVIEEVGINEYKVKYDGYPELYVLTRSQFHFVNKPVDIEGPTSTKPAGIGAPSTVRSTAGPERRTFPASSPFVEGAKIEAQEGAIWYAATIKEIKEGKYLVKWEGYDQENWLPVEKLRPMAMLPAEKLKVASGATYIRSIRWIATGYTELRWFFLGNNGVIVANPVHGLNPVNFSLEQVDNRKNVGNYNISNNQIHIRWLNGNTSTLALKYRNGDIIEMDAGGIMVRQKGLPANFRIGGTYSGTMAFGGVSSGGTYVFSKDGSVAVKKTGSVNAGVTGGMAESEKRGAYAIKGNTLTIAYADGTTEVANIGVFGDDKLVINGTWLSRQ